MSSSGFGAGRIVGTTIPISKTDSEKAIGPVTKKPHSPQRLPGFGTEQARSTPKNKPK
jgi:hypothetical protein